MKKYGLVDFQKNHQDEDNIIDLIKELSQSSAGNGNEVIVNQISKLLIRAIRSQVNKNEIIIEIKEWAKLLYMIDQVKSRLKGDTLNQITNKKYNDFSKSYLESFVLPFVKKLEEEDKKYKQLDKKVTNWEVERINIINDFNSLIKELDKKSLEIRPMN